MKIVIVICPVLMHSFIFKSILFRIGKIYGAAFLAHLSATSICCSALLDKFDLNLLFSLKLNKAVSKDSTSMFYTRGTNPQYFGYLLVHQHNYANYASQLCSLSFVNLFSQMQNLGTQANHFSLKIQILVLICHPEVSRFRHYSIHSSFYYENIIDHRLTYVRRFSNV